MKSKQWPQKGVGGWINAYQGVRQGRPSGRPAALARPAPSTPGKRLSSTGPRRLLVLPSRRYLPLPPLGWFRVHPVPPGGVTERKPLMLDALKAVLAENSIFHTIGSCFTPSLSSLPICWQPSIRWFQITQLPSSS